MPTTLSGKSRGGRLLDTIEWLGNALPDPAVLFLIALAATWCASAWLAPVQFREIDPRTLGQRDAAGEPLPGQPIRVKNQLTGPALATFLTRIIKNFTEFPPLGVVLVAMLGVGVAEHVGLLQALLKWLMSFTPRRLLTPMLLFVSLLSHAAGDTGFVLVIPLGGVLFAAAGRHPLAGIVAAFAGVAGAFSASFLPSSLDPLLQGFTESAAQILAPERHVNPLCNWWFMCASSGLLILVGWLITDLHVEPRLARLAVDGDDQEQVGFTPLSSSERLGLWCGLLAAAIGAGLLVAVCWPAESPLRGPPPARSLTAHGAPLMEAIVPLIFLLFLLPSAVYGYAAGTVRSHRDIVGAMSKSMSSMGYYLVMAFFAAQFTYAFRESNIGTLLAIKGAQQLADWQLPGPVTIVGIILLSVAVDLFVGSASAKWAIMAPIFVPMLMRVGISPELTQAAYRVGDSTTNVITPLMPYFPLVVVFCQRYVKKTGIGTLVALMLPYSVIFLALWTILLLLFWQLGIPLGLQSTYSYP